MGQVGDPFDLPWLVFDLSQRGQGRGRGGGAAVIETYGENVEH